MRLEDFFSASELAECQNAKKLDHDADLSKQLGSIRDMATAGRHTDVVELYRAARDELLTLNLALAPIDHMEMFTHAARAAINTSQKKLFWRILADMDLLSAAFSLSFYESVLKTFAAKKQYVDAMRCFEHAQCRGNVTPSVTMHSCRLSFSLELADEVAAEQSFQYIQEMGSPTIRQYMSILKVYQKTRRWKAALSTIKGMMYSAATGHGIAPDDIIVNIILSTLIAEDRLAEAELLAAELSSQWGLVDRIGNNTLIKGYANRSDFQGARAVLATMRARNIEPDERSYNTVMDAAVRAGMLEGAWELFEEMQYYGKRPDKCTHTTICKGLYNLEPPSRSSPWLDSCVLWAESNFNGLRWNASDDGPPPWERRKMPSITDGSANPTTNGAARDTRSRSPARKSKKPAREFIDNWDEI